ncbi:hypothetical protein CSAL01_00263 [Colletotrichum salicis]|uniref:Amidohydrolase-related domain-containing protein n=1 Tax=Colletotrichum salicis TaxID=1209931 RepID=A0A135V6S8_9PEZI|nr:hypothetical protein CSAL01_00263 [Colletotrichum salicis]
MSGKYLITGGHIFTLDDSVGDFDNDAILVENGIIKAIGKASEISAPDAEVIDATEGVIIPGMVDAHRHVSMSLTRGIGVDQHLWHFLSNTYTRWLPATGVEEMYTSALVGALEAIESGVTTIMDTWKSFHSAEHAESELQGLKDSGTRAFFCYGMSGDHTWGKMVGEDSGEGLVRVALQLSQSGTTPFAWMNDEVKLAQDKGLLCCLPLERRTRLQPDERLGGQGGYVMSLISETGGKIVLSPDTDIRMSMGFPPLRLALAHGLNPALSIDTSSAVPPDLLSQMRLQLQRVSLKMDFGVRDALVWGMRNGAEAVGLGDKIGTLKPGQRADIVVITNKRALSGSANPLGTAVRHSTSADIDLVMVDGKILKRDGKLVGVDVDSIRAKSREGLRRIQANLRSMRPEMSPEEIRNFFLQGEKAHRVNVANAYAQGTQVADYLRPA